MLLYTLPHITYDDMTVDWRSYYMHALHARHSVSKQASEQASGQARTHLNEHYELDKNESNAHIYDRVYNVCIERRVAEKRFQRGK